MQPYNLYSDGNYFPRAKKSGFGGYIESPSGEILTEYSEQIKSFEYQHSFELLGIIRGLQYAKNLGIKNIRSHCDDKNTAFKLKEVFEDGIFNISESLKPELFEEIIQLSKGFDSIKFEYIPRSNNKYADSLSRRYAELMEINFIRQFEDDVSRSERRFEKGQNLNKKSYFSHKSLVKTSHKNNPFLVANVRNKKVRRVSKQEAKQEYCFLFNEIFSDNDFLHIKSFLYNNNEKSLLKSEQFPASEQENNEEIFCNYFSNTLNEIKKTGIKKIWICSNHQKINKILEQKEKIHQRQWPLYKNIHDALNGFERVFFNNFPFEHKYSPQIAQIESNKNSINNTLLSIEELIEEFDSSQFSKDRGKYFGAIVRHELHNLRDKFDRELTSLEIQNVIDNTLSNLERKGCTNLPKINKI